VCCIHRLMSDYTNALNARRAEALARPSQKAAVLGTWDPGTHPYIVDTYKKDTRAHQGYYTIADAFQTKAEAMAFFESPMGVGQFERLVRAAVGWVPKKNGRWVNIARRKRLPSRGWPCQRT
jgi:LmbE family N-acetylglucosaminyl deacetylase